MFDCGTFERSPKAIVSILMPTRPRMSESATACLTWPIPLVCTVISSFDGSGSYPHQHTSGPKSQPTIVRIT